MAMVQPGRRITIINVVHDKLRRKQRAEGKRDKVKWFLFLMFNLLDGGFSMSENWCQLAFERKTGISREFMRSAPACSLSSDKNRAQQLKMLRPTLSEAGNE